MFRAHDSDDLGPVSIRAQVGCVASALADRLVAAAGAAFARGGRVALAVSPAALDETLVGALSSTLHSQGRFWRSTHLFWTDTRFAGATSCAASARALALRLPLPEANLHLEVGDAANPVRAADLYEQELRAFFALAAGEVPQFDLAVVAITECDRVAGLAPGGRALDEVARLAVAEFSPGAGRCVVTLTPPVLARARLILATAPAGSAASVRARLARPDFRSRDPLRMLRAAQGGVDILIAADEPTTSFR